MQYAVWIALAVVFIALAPSMIKAAKGKGSSNAAADADNADGGGTDSGGGDGGGD